MKINTIIEIAKKLDMNINDLEVESGHNGLDGYILRDGEKTYIIEFVLTEFMSARVSPDGVAKTYSGGKIENAYNSKEKHDLLDFLITNKLI